MLSTLLRVEMVSPFSTPVLRYLQAVHDAPRPVGPTVLDALPGMVRERTLYRWQRSLGERLTYFPSLCLSGLGLVHAHLFLEGASDRWLDLPVVLSACWVNRGLERPGLYLHCVVPAGEEASFEGLVRALSRDGWCAEYTLVLASDGWQCVGLAGLDRDGRVRTRPMSVLREGVFRVAVDQRGLLQSYPFIVPAVFEAPEERCSLQEVWRRVHDRLGSMVWRYFPRGTRRWPVNGKRYVRHAMELVVAAGLFRQNIIRYRPLLDDGLEVFVVLKTEEVEELVRGFGSVCPVVDVARAQDGRVLLRLTGDHDLVYEVLRVAREVVRPLGVWVHDARHHDAALRRVRFQYETLFDPVTGAWRFSAADILSSLRGKA
jgi:hypothetical protein